MIIFPLGFFILEGKRPVYLGNDLEAQKAVRTWINANPDKLHLSLDVIGPVQFLTRSIGCNESNG